MKTLLWLETALTTLLAAGSVVKLISLGIQMSMNPEERGSYAHELKRVITVAILNLVVSSSSILILVYQYVGGS